MIKATSVLALLAAMAAGWSLRRLLLKAMEARHPREFEALGRPSSRNLASMLPKHREAQIQFWTHLWGGRFFRLQDAAISRLAWAILASDCLLVASAFALFWSAGR